jgi:frataxin-like iron-binding protein CyaY
MFGNKHKEEFLRGADAYTLEVAEQLDNATKELLVSFIYVHTINNVLTVFAGHGNRYKLLLPSD